MNELIERLTLDDSELDLLLRGAAPQPSVPPGLAGHRDRILAGAKARRTHRLWMWSVGAAAAVVALGGGSAAMAGGGMETPWGWVADNVFSASNGVEDCYAGFTISGIGVDDDSPIVLEAKAYVSSLDLDALDTTQMEADIRESDLAATDENGDPTPDVLQDAELKHMAVWRVASEMTWAHLESQGYEAELIGFDMANDECAS